MALAWSPEICSPQQHCYQQPANPVQPVAQPISAQQVNRICEYQFNGWQINGHYQSNGHEPNAVQQNNPSFYSQTNLNHNYDLGNHPNSATFQLGNFQKAKPHNADYNANTIDSNQNYPGFNSSNCGVNCSVNNGAAYQVVKTINQTVNQTISQTVFQPGAYNIDNCSARSTTAHPCVQTNATFGPNYDTILSDQVASDQSLPYQQTNPQIYSQTQSFQQNHPQACSQESYQQPTNQPFCQPETYRQQSYSQQVYPHPQTCPQQQVDQQSYPPPTCQQQFYQQQTYEPQINQPDIPALQLLTAQNQNDQPDIPVLQPPIAHNQNDQIKPDTITTEGQNLEKLRRYLPEFVETLNDADMRLVIAVLKSVLRLFFVEKNKQKTEIATQSLPLIQTMVKLAVNHDYQENVELIKLVSFVFHYGSRSTLGTRTIFDCGYLNAASAKLLTTNDYHVTANALSTLHCLVKGVEDAKGEVSERGIAILVRLLDFNPKEPKFLYLIVDTLRLVAFQDPKAKEKILEYDGTKKLIHIVTDCEHEKLLTTTLRLFRILSICPANKTYMVETGCLQRLTRHLSSSSPPVAANALWTITHLSDRAANQKKLDELLKTLVALLAGSVEPYIMVSVARCIANLTRESKMNKQLVFQYNGMEALLRALLRAGRDEALLEPLLTAIRHMTREHPSFGECQKIMRSAGIIGAIVQHMSCVADPVTGSPAFKWSTNRAAVQLVRNLGRNPLNADMIREHGALELLFDLLKMASDQRKIRGDQYEMSGVNVRQFICDILFAFNVLSQNPANCQHLINLNFIPLCMEMIACQRDTVIDLIVTILSTLAGYPLGAEKLSLDDANIAAFNSLLNSTESEETSANVSSILFRIEEYKRKDGSTNFDFLTTI